MRCPWTKRRQMLRIVNRIAYKFATGSAVPFGGKDVVATRATKASFVVNSRSSFKTEQILLIVQILLPDL
jgi:hypothetical protein